jgi:hypothetical protein
MLVSWRLLGLVRGLQARDSGLWIGCTVFEVLPVDLVVQYCLNACISYDTGYVALLHQHTDSRSMRHDR